MQAPNGWVLSEAGLGPFDDDTKASEKGLAALVPSLRVKVNDLGGASGIVYDIFDGDEQLFYVVPDDVDGWNEDMGNEDRYAPTMFAIFAVSPRVRVHRRSWQVGKNLEELHDLDSCECWGQREVTACHRRGSRVRVVFELPCLEADEQGPKVMLGKPIARLMWQRVPELEDASPSE